MTATSPIPIWLQLKRKHVRADTILAKFGVEGPPVDIEGIAQWLGVPVLTVPSPGWSGAVESDEKTGEATIWVAAEESAFRRRFTIAHEIGHLILHPAGEAYRDYPDFSGSKLEAQANGYAAALLMPLSMLDAYASRFGPDIRRLARLFEVSEAAMNIRLGKIHG